MRRSRPLFLLSCCLRCAAAGGWCVIHSRAFERGGAAKVQRGCCGVGVRRILVNRRSVRPRSACITRRPPCLCLLVPLSASTTLCAVVLLLDVVVGSSPNGCLHVSFTSGASTVDASKQVQSCDINANTTTTALIKQRYQDTLTANRSTAKVVTSTGDSVSFWPGEASLAALRGAQRSGAAARIAQALRSSRA